MNPRYIQLYEELRESINQGAYRAGQRLPASRVLAKERGVSRNTVIRAYDMLVSEGYIVSRVGDGMHVNHDLPDKPWLSKGETSSAKVIGIEPEWSAWAKQINNVSTYKHLLQQHREKHLQLGYEITVDFQYGHVEMSESTLLQWRRLAAKWSRLQSQAYGDVQGLVALRKALDSHLSTYRGCCSHPDNIVVTSSAQQLFTLVVSLIAQRGDTIVIEEPWYHRFRDILMLADINIVSVPVDHEGLNIEELSRVTTDKGIRPKLIYVTPSHQFPTGVVMSLQRRLALLDWCHQHNVWILEDDYDSEYRYQGQPIDALQSLDKEGRVIYAGTASKVICPSLCIAYGLFPDAWISRMVEALRHTHRHSAWLEQHMLAEFIDKGFFVSHIRRQRRRYESNRVLLVRLLKKYFGENIHIEGDMAGLHILIWLPQWHIDQQGEVLIALAQRGVALYPIDHLYNRPRKPLGLLMGYATLTHEQIEHGVMIMRDVLDQFS